ncbi:MAG: hypothetical protein JSS07_02955 [Proteobacteria bacterium]|nr:hypothetical protein [Pseudomonadota bacterium]
MKRGADELILENETTSNSDHQAAVLSNENNLEGSEQVLALRVRKDRARFRRRFDKDFLTRTEFNHIFSTKTLLSEEMLGKLKILFENGATPNFYLFDKKDEDTRRSRFISPLFYAIAHHDIKLFNLLLAYNANVTAPCKIYEFRTNEEFKLYSPENSFYTAIHSRALPIQQVLLKSLSSIEQKPFHEMYSILFEKMKKEIPNFFDDIERKFEDAYCSILNKLQAEISISIQKNLKLLVLIGESHRAKFSYAIHRMVCLAAQHLKFFDGLLFEIDKLDYAPFTQENPDHGWGRLIKMVKEMGLKVIPIDLGRYDGDDSKAAVNFEWSMSTEGIKHRNDVMASTIPKNESHFVGVVGAIHLYGLEKETNLKNYFHVTCINATSFEKYANKELNRSFQSEQRRKEYSSGLGKSSQGEYSKICCEFYNSNHVFQTETFLSSDLTSDTLSTILSSNEIDNLILKVHEKQKLTTNPPTLLTSFRKTTENVEANENYSATARQNVTKKLGTNL